LTDRASAYDSKRDYDRAIADYSTAIRLVPRDSSLWFHRGMIYYYNKDDYDRAIADYNEAIRLDPRRALYIASRGEGYEKKGEFEKAVVDFRDALTIEADNKYATDGLERIEKRGGARTRNAAVVAPPARAPVSPPVVASPPPAPAPAPPPPVAVFAPPPPVGSPAPAAPVVSVKALFDKHGLLGTFSTDCGKPVAQNNRYFINRAMDDGRVQRDQMSGPATRVYATVFDLGAEVTHDEIALIGTREGQAAEVIFHVEANRMRPLEVTVGGRKEVSNGRFVSGAEAPWLKKCPAPGR
jgi:tetratricopeptide (TPR) repeat protein